jgi:hypothetical protein
VNSIETTLEILRRSPVAGRRTLRDGTELIGHVPHVAPEAWFHEIYAGLGSEDILEIERLVLMPLSPAIKSFFSCANGLNLYSDALAIHGLRRTYERTGDAARQPYHIETANVDERPRSAPKSALFLGSYSWDGSGVYVDSATQRVFRCHRRDCKAFNEWSSFIDFLEAEVNRLGALFDIMGRKRNPSLPTVPS